MAFFSKELKNEFETAVVNEPSVFEPLKVYCIFFLDHTPTYNLGYILSPYQMFGKVDKE